MGQMGWKDESRPSVAIESSWIKHHDSSKNVPEDSLMTKIDLPQKDKNSNQAPEKNTQVFILPQAYNTRRSPRKNPDSFTLFQSLISSPYFSIHHATL
jgi:hypothetical protein